MIDRNTIYFFFDELGKEAGIGSMLAKGAVGTAAVGGLGYVGNKTIGAKMRQKAQLGADPFHKQAGIGDMLARGVQAVGSGAQRLGAKGVAGGAVMTGIGLYGLNKFRKNLKEKQPQVVKPMMAQTGMGRY